MVSRLLQVSDIFFFRYVGNVLEKYGAISWEALPSGRLTLMQQISRAASFA